MNNYFKVGTIIVIAAALFAFGRFSAPAKTVTEVKTVEVEKVVVKHEVTTVYKLPDGSSKTVTTIDTNTKTDTEVKDSNKTEAISKDKINISLLAGTTSFKFDTPVYGISANKNILGPITGGIWALTDKTVGVSLGLNF